jgi:hypothetical protein
MRGLIVIFKPMPSASLGFLLERRGIFKPIGSHTSRDFDVRGDVV